MSDSEPDPEPMHMSQHSEAVWRFIRAMQALDIEQYGATIGPGAEEINLLERMWQLPARGES